MLIILVTLILAESMAVSGRFIVSSKVEDVFNQTLRVNYTNFWKASLFDL